MYSIIKIKGIRRNKKMKKMMWGNHIVKAYLESWDGGKGVRTVYLDENGNEVVKINGHICKLSDFMGKVELF